MKELPKRHREILSYLPNGYDIMITNEELVNLTGLSEREIYLILNELPMKYDIPVGSSRDSSHNGFYIPMSEEEKLAGIRSLEEQGRSILSRVAKVKKCDIATAQYYKEKYKLTPANRPVQTTFQFEYERTPQDKVNH